MATKVIIIGQEPKKKEQKKIEFHKSLTVGIAELVDATYEPKDWDNIELICKNYGVGIDLMFAYYDNNRSGGVLYLGKFNDGIV